MRRGDREAVVALVMAARAELFGALYVSFSQLDASVLAINPFRRCYRGGV
jgi:hypothetical protein